VAARTLINMQPLPPRAGFLNRDQADKDIREAMVLAEKRLYDQAARLSVAGWWAPGDVTYDVQNHIVVGMLKLERPD
jgi:hypothetical protein